MTDEGNHLDGNTARLIRAASGPSVRPSDQARERTFRSLRDLVRARYAGAGFPDVAVALLGGALLAMLAWLAIQLGQQEPLRPIDPSLLVAAAWVLPNLAAVPVAAIVISIRRNRD